MTPEMTKSPRMTLDAETKIEYITDVEGNWEYFLSLVNGSSIVHVEDDEKADDGTISLSLSPDSMVVHGGDVPDKGPGDIRVVKALVRLKKRYPTRVFLLSGNRDVNKLRFMSELAEGETGRGTDVYWDAKHQTYADFIAEKGLIDGSVSTLKWMLSCTMGCPTTFKTRRAELALINQQHLDSVSDEQVLASFRESVNPASSDPWMLEYLRCGQLALVVGDCLFVHGGVSKACLGRVPNKSGVVSGGLDAWCAALNHFYDDMVRDFEHQPTWDSERKRGGEALLNYGVPGGFGGATVMYCNSFVQNGNCVPPDLETRDYLDQAAVRRVFVGHTPHGECPSVISVTKPDLTVFLCDTSYSDMKADKTNNPADNRGIAATNVLIGVYHTTVTGALSNGDSHGYCLPSSESILMPESLPGRQLADDSWVKTIVHGKPMVAKGKGYTLSTRIMTIDDILLQLKEPLPN